jgi:hypothetical protein
MNPVLLAWMVEAGIITAQSLSQDKQLPLPSRFLASFIVFGALGGLAESATFRNAATYAAWGLVIATAMPTVVNASGVEVKKGGYFDLFTTIGDFMAGKSNAAAVQQSTVQGTTAPAESGTGNLSAGLGGTVSHRSGQQP